MSYTPTNWQTGDTVTAALLNKMEQGIAADDALVVPIYHELVYPQEGGSPYDEYYVPAEYAQAVYDGFFEHPTVFFSFYETYSSGIHELQVTFEAKWIKSEIGSLPSTAVFTTDYLERGLTYIIQTPDQTGKKPFDTWILNKTGYVAGEKWYLTAVALDRDFVVTLTPTSQDFSGTMDKTPQEINSAVQNEKRIIFAIPSFGGMVEATQFLHDQSTGLYMAYANLTFDPGTGTALIIIGSDPNASTYHTSIYPLTPMS